SDRLPWGRPREGNRPRAGNNKVQGTYFSFTRALDGRVVPCYPSKVQSPKRPMQREKRPAGRQTLARLVPLFGVALLALTSVACNPPNAERPQTKKFVPRAEVQTREHVQGANSGLSPLGLEPESRCENIERPNPERWSKEVDHYLEEDEKQFPEPGRVVFVGSSSIRLWKTLETDMAPVPTLRRGLGGAIIRDAIYYADTLIAPYEPGAVVL